jgi:hypothetical protein
MTTLNLTIIDKSGCQLLVTTDVSLHKFDAVTVSPDHESFRRPDPIGMEPAWATKHLNNAFFMTRRLNEVCLLPEECSRYWRVLLTPSLPLRKGTKGESSKLMIDLFDASQTPEVKARTLLIKHFNKVRAYPEKHLLGIFEGLTLIASNSFGKLRVLCIEIPEKHLQSLEAHARQVLDSVLRPETTMH